MHLVAQWLGRLDPVARHVPAPPSARWPTEPLPPSEDGDPRLHRCNAGKGTNIAGTWDPMTLALWRDLWARVERLEAELER